MAKYKEAFAKRMSIAGLKPHHRIALGVSGGPDSVALCFLTAGWKKDALIGIDETNGCIDGLLAIVVDHGLRKESKDEANLVRDRVSKMGIRCEIANCDWVDGRPKQGHLQEAARDMRYQIFQNVCIENQIGVLLIAHHADDQGELFILRLSRNSGVLGLAGMAFTSQLFSTHIHCYGENSSSIGTLLVRPLLEFSKEDMYKICQKGNLEWVEDPTNQSLLFARNRIRTFRSEMQAIISACRKTRSFVDKICSDLINQTVTVMAFEWLLKEHLQGNMKHGLDIVNLEVVQTFATPFEHGYAIIDLEKLDPSNVEDIYLSKFSALVLQFISQRHRPVRGRTSKLLLDYMRNFPIQTSLTAAACYLCAAPRSKGTKILVCCSIDSPQPSEMDLSHRYLCEGKKQSTTREIEQILMNAKSNSDCLVPDTSNVPFLHATTSETILDEGKRLNILSESTHRSILLLQKEEIKHFNAKTETKLPEHEPRHEIKSASTYLIAPLRPGQVYHFMDRFLFMWRLQKKITDDIFPVEKIDSNWNLEWAAQDFLCNSCVVGQEAAVRHMIDADWLYLASLSKGQTMELCQENKLLSACKMDKRTESTISCSDYVRLSAQRALQALKSIPVAARRGLPVLVNSQGLLLSIPIPCLPDHGVEWSPSRGHRIT
ncbi:tRNA(Ile)-lysidine/2-thiocytidine synthase [Macleaya cordata]|uniref:tRNA(Ile)-lysidine synthetase n=1 Tax=Macleaya cordata TaxID=56857 RepID=A0A200RCF0_MACCD|nr:tRNA(Ile)-lysidine/2-thiocytidine synthase [Macleaya cordata]